MNYQVLCQGKRQTSRETRLRHPFAFSEGAAVDVPSNSSYSSIGEEPVNLAVAHSSDTQYEIIQQSRYTYYNTSIGQEETKDDQSAPMQFKDRTIDNEEEEEEDVKEKEDEEKETAAIDERENERDYRDYRENSKEEHHLPRCCLDVDSNQEWEIGEQSMAQMDDDDARSVEV